MLREDCLKIAREAADQSVVLLKNEGGVLPLRSGERIALFGVGQIYTVMGGLGSGAVDYQDGITILEGLKQGGFIVDEALEEAYSAWAKHHANGMRVPDIRLQSHSNPEYLPTKEEIALYSGRNDTAVIILSRVSGEGFDREAGAGDYCLTETEITLISWVAAAFPKTVLVLNTCGIIEIAPVYELVKSILFLGIPGQEAGHVLSDILTGASEPSGKLAVTWAEQYKDNPACSHFGLYKTNGNINTIQVGPLHPYTAEQYEIDYCEDIYV